MNYSKIIGNRCCGLTKIADMLIINFGKPIVVSIHAFCFVRITKRSDIIFTTSDELFDVNGALLDNDAVDEIVQTGAFYSPKSLFARNLEKVNSLLNGKKVVAIYMSETFDLAIFFDGGIRMDIILDCLKKDMEYYRFIEFVPHWDTDIKNYESIHYIVSNKYGEIKVTVES